MVFQKSLSIVHCLSPATVGGLESVVRALAVGHTSRGHLVTLAATVETKNHPFVTALRREGVDTVELHVSSREFKKARTMIAEVIESRQPHIVHSHGYRPDILDLPVARRFNIPTVSTLHGFTGGDWKLRLYERLQMRSVRNASAAVAVSRNVYDRLRGAKVPAETLHLIPNAYTSHSVITSTTETRAHARSILGIPDDQFQVAWIGRMSQEKAPDIMIETAGLTHEPGISFSFVGDGPMRPTVEQRTAELGLNNRVTMHGVVHNVAQLFPAFDLFVLSSRTEGTPIVVLEAMAAGIPIVATNVGGVPDMLSNNEALLVPPNDPAALANAIRSAYHDPTGTVARAERARQRLLSDFSLDPWLDRYESLYRSLIA